MTGDVHGFKEDTNYDLLNESHVRNQSTHPQTLPFLTLFFGKFVVPRHLFKSFETDTDGFTL